VLAAEVTELFRNADRVLDCTLGGGGHALALLEAGIQSVVGVDRDPQALAAATSRLHAFAQAGRFSAVESNYAQLEGLSSLQGMTFDGILLDLGISSHQVDESDRGFTFRPGARLDMRMGADASTDAGELLNTEDEATLTRIFKTFGDEPRAARLAHEIVRRRANKPFETSDDLVGAIRAVLGARSGAAEFARLFQAVRIAVNDELAGLERALPVLRDRLIPGGTLAVISYHSGEDRIVKERFAVAAGACECPPDLPCVCGAVQTVRLVRGVPKRPSIAEREANRRAASARLRVVEKIDPIANADRKDR